ncbi:MAG: hypothetical protein ACYCO5_05440 [Acidobacteriaceae bacterium]
MSVVRSRLLLMGVSAALVVGCGGGGKTTGGGGGGGGGSNPTVVTLTFAATPTLLAAQIGSGAFTAQTLSGNTLTLSIPSGTSNYAVAYLCPTQTVGQGQYAEEEVWEASTADGNSLNLTCTYVSGSSGTQGTLTGSLNASAIPGVTSFAVAAQNGNAMGEGGAGGSSATASFTLPAPTGSDRVLVLAYGSSSLGPLAAKNFTNQTVPGALNGGNTVVFGAADQTTIAPITYNNVPSGFSSPSTYVSLQTTSAPVVIALASAATAQYSVYRRTPSKAETSTYSRHLPLQAAIVPHVPIRWQPSPVAARWL